jgi:hypothetical protein
MNSVNVNELIFYTLIFLMFYIFSYSSNYLSSYFKINNNITMLLFGLLLSGIIFLLRKYQTKDNFFFELTPEKHCEGGSYMYSSSPEKQKFCSQFTPKDIKYYSCTKGFHGAPVHWERTDMSDSKWENKMCDGNFDEYNDPKVL